MIIMLYGYGLKKCNKAWKQNCKKYALMRNKRFNMKTIEISTFFPPCLPWIGAEISRQSCSYYQFFLLLSSNVIVHMFWQIFNFGLQLGKIKRGRTVRVSCWCMLSFSSSCGSTYGIESFSYSPAFGGGGGSELAVAMCQWILWLGRSAPHQGCVRMGRYEVCQTHVHFLKTLIFTRTFLALNVWKVTFGEGSHHIVNGSAGIIVGRVLKTKSTCGLRCPFQKFIFRVNIKPGEAWLTIASGSACE